LEFLSSSLSISFSEMSLPLSSWKTTFISNLCLSCHPSLHSLSSLHSASELSDIRFHRLGKSNSLSISADLNSYPRFVILGAALYFVNVANGFEG
jgi:hypothetical protein